MATLYYRPYTSELKQDDLDDEDNQTDMLSDKDSELPEFQYIFQNTDEADNDSGKYEQNDSKYRLAVRRMSTEIMQLRDHIRKLASNRQGDSCQTNSFCHICGNCDQSKTTNQKPIIVGELVNLDTISKEQLISKYVSLKDQFCTLNDDLRCYQDKVHKLQKELIKKNEKEAEYLKITKAHSSQNAMLHDMQKKVTKIKQLEETVKDQEMIISKMEKHIEKQKSDKIKSKSRKLSPIAEVNSSREDERNVLKKENNRLKQEIDSIKNVPTFMPQTNGMSDSERLELYQLLDKAENRILSLEKQVSLSHRERGQKVKAKKDQDNFGLSKIELAESLN